MSSAQRNVPTNYFVCTLGEAIDKSSVFKDLETVNDFIDQQAKAYPKTHVVGFPTPKEQEQKWGFELFTFQELRNGSMLAAEELTRVLAKGDSTSNSKCIALLCPSSIDFLFAWLGLMRAGSSVLLIAPQCQPAAIAHLCKACNVSILVHDTTYESLAVKAVSESKFGLQAVTIPWQLQKTPFTSILRNQGQCDEPQPEVRGKATDVAFVLHTSGTSSGLPKPIPQSHHAAFRVLPSLDGRDDASFTTTPLYHGGIADCFRAWTSRALIWLFPAAHVPITTRNVLHCLTAAREATLIASTATVAYFATVPYILQMLADDRDGMEALKEMKIVSVGGAALSPPIGDQLVEQGVNLVSRFGSAECGFLLSSRRDYETDKDWQYLRLSPQSKYLVFEGSADDLDDAELIVKQGWPHIAKCNREDGSFATSDLFKKHADIQGAWMYVGRNDSQITLSTGQKFDPVPLEDLLAASSPLIREVIVFGNEKHRPGCLVFPSAEASNYPDAEAKQRIWQVVNEINGKGQYHTQISRDMLIVMSVNGPRLDRSSKGTILRGIAEKTFADEIERAYNTNYVHKSEEFERTSKPEDVNAMIQTVVEEALGYHLEDDADFYKQGVDSAACVRIRSLIKKNIVGDGCTLPFNVVYDCGSIKQLTNFVARVQKGKAEVPLREHTEMLELADKYASLVNEKTGVIQKEEVHNESKVVLLTGATGALGAHLLDRLRQDPSVSQVFCLVRAVDHYAARSRVSASLLKRKKPPLDFTNSKIWCAPCKLSEGDLGLAEMELAHLHEKATHVIHAAWAVNFTLPLKSFVDAHITGLHNLLKLTTRCTRKVDFTFCSSTASISGSSRPPIQEEISQQPADASPIGYSRSKWVAEAICANVAKKLPGTVQVLRIGQLTGDTEHGVWNVSEAYPLMLMAGDTLNALPELQDPLSWIPMDTAANAVVQLALRNKTISKRCEVYHIVNNSTETTWMDLLDWTVNARAKPFDIVPPAAWLDALESSPQRIPAKNLLGFWRKAYPVDPGPKGNEKQAQISFSVTNAVKHSDAMQNLPSVDQTLITKIWYWLEEEMKAAKVQIYVSKNRFNSV